MALSAEKRLALSLPITLALFAAEVIGGTRKVIPTSCSKRVHATLLDESKGEDDDA